MYGDSSNGFDSLIQKRGRAFLSGLGRFSSREGNNAYGDRLYHCDCSDCRELLLRVCIYPSDFIGMMDICGCAEGFGPFPCHIYDDPCRAEGKDYTCNQLICGLGCDMNPCCPELPDWSDGNRSGGNEHLGDLRAETISPRFGLGLMQSIPWRQIGRLATEGNLCFCMCWHAIGGDNPIFSAWATYYAFNACTEAERIRRNFIAGNPDYMGQDDVNDARRHCVFTCILEKEPKTTRCAHEILLAHEIVSRTTWDAFRMDEHNNHEGTLCANNPSKTCKQCCDDKIASKKLWWIISGHGYSPNYPPPNWGWIPGQPPSEPSPVEPNPWDPVPIV